MFQKMRLELVIELASSKIVCLVNCKTYKSALLNHKNLKNNDTSPLYLARDQIYINENLPLEREKV